MKKQLKGFVCGVLAGTMLLSTVFATDYFQLTRSDAKVIVNNVVQDTGNLPILNYNGNTYVPLRASVESIGGGVWWDANKKEIYLWNEKLYKTQDCFRAYDNAKSMDDAIGFLEKISSQIDMVFYSDTSDFLFEKKVSEAKRVYKSYNDIWKIVKQTSLNYIQNNNTHEFSPILKQYVEKIDELYLLVNTMLVTIEDYKKNFSEEKGNKYIETLKEKNEKSEKVEQEIIDSMRKYSLLIYGL